MSESEHSDKSAESNVQAARGMLADFEDLTNEEKAGAIHHAISELENARREL